MARTDYGAILSTVIKDTSDAVREVNGTSSLIAPNQWGTAIRTMHSDTDYENALEQMIEETATGDIASFSDGANDIPLKSLACTIKPVQDLHGQNYPYPSGGGKNELAMSISGMQSLNTAGSWNGNVYVLNGISFTIITDTADNITGIKVGGTATADATFSIAMYILKEGTSKKINGTSINPSATTISYGFRGYGTVSANADRNMTRQEGAGDWDNDVYINVATGYTANNLMYYPMIRDASISDGTFAPYSNICPITGHTELNLVHTGKNLFDKTKGTTGKYLNGNGYEINSGSYNITDYIEVKGGANITISGESTGGSAPCICYYDKNKTLLSAESHSGFSIPHTYTVPSNAYYFRESYESASIDTFQIEYGNSASAYSSYVTETTRTADLGTTVYGGTLDVETGVMTVDRAIVDLGSLDWIYQSAIPRFYTTGIANVAKGSAQIADIICSNYKPSIVPTSASEDKTIALALSGNLFVKDTSYTDESEFKTAMNGVQLVYELATPVTTQLTPQEVKSLLGSNNFYHDCNGQVAVTYRANGQLYVAQHS